MKLQLFSWPNPSGYLNAAVPNMGIDGAAIPGAAATVAATRDGWIVAFNAVGSDVAFTYNGYRMRAVAIGESGIGVIAKSDSGAGSVGIYPSDAGPLTNGNANSATATTLDANYVTLLTSATGAGSYSSQIALALSAFAAGRITA